jgi:hypothetical protein
MNSYITLFNRILGLLSVFALLLFSAQAFASNLYVGRSTTDITPKLPVAVTGQFNLRIAREAETPLTANVVVLETREGSRSLDQAIMVSCDVLYIPTDVVALVRQKVKSRVSDMDVSKIVLNATHTHTAPVLREGEYAVPKEGVTQVETYRQFFSDQIADAIANAWRQRDVGSVAWGFSYAVVGYNRRVVYADGTSGMSSNTNLPEFRNLEGSEDHDINTLFFWDKSKQLIAMVIGVASPSQEVEGRSAVNADYWHPVRERIAGKYGKQVVVLGWLGASGDLTPHLRYRKAADDRMRELRKLSRLEELARRIVLAVDEAYDAVKNEGKSELPLVHRVERLTLPERQVTARDYSEAKASVENAKKQIADDPKVADRLYRRMTWEAETLKRYERQQKERNPLYAMDLHVIRLGDIAICTNEFELFSDFGIRMQARSKAIQTFVVQLAGSPEWGAYLPTDKAVRGGAYSAIVHSSRVGPEGGQVLVDRTVEILDELWEKK